MPTRLPKYESTYCRLFTVCGKLGISSDKIISDILPKKPLIISYRTAEQRAFLQLLPAGEKSISLHIESALKECFPIEFVPKPNSKKADLDSVLKQLNGASIEAAISAGFELPLLKLPEEGLVRSLITKHKTGDLTMRLTGATCKIEGTPVQELEWKLKDSEKDIRIRIEGSFHEIIDDGYLVRSFKWIENLFNLFILGKASNGNA